MELNLTDKNLTFDLLKKYLSKNYNEENIYFNDNDKIVRFYNINVNILLNDLFDDFSWNNIVVFSGMFIFNECNITINNSICSEWWFIKFNQCNIFNKKNIELSTDWDEWTIILSNCSLNWWELKVFSRWKWNNVIV